MLISVKGALSNIWKTLLTTVSDRVPKHTCGFVYNFWFTCKKGSVKVNHTKQKKSTLYLVRTKASELADFPGVNTPLDWNFRYRKSFDSDQDFGESSWIFWFRSELLSRFVNHFMNWMIHVPLSEVLIWNNGSRIIIQIETTERGAKHLFYIGTSEP